MRRLEEFMSDASFQGGAMSDMTADRDPFEVVAESFLARFRSGELPSIDDLAARHPELADQIRELLPALLMVEQDMTIDRDPAREQPPPALAPG
jgi:eukaryotic-like serine/threonine-protein kinase